MEIAQVSLLGGLLALDATAVGQFMLSRPLVAGALTGWVLDEPAIGLAIGAVLELYLLVSFPTGGSRFPEGATATVVAVASAASVDAVGALPLAVAVGLVWGQLGGASVSLMRTAHSRLVPEPGEPRAGPRAVTAAHLGAITVDLLRATLVTLTGVLAGQATVVALAGRWPLAASASLGLLLVGGSVSAGILLRDLGGFRRHGPIFVAGLALGVIGARLL